MASVDRQPSLLPSLSPSYKQPFMVIAQNCGPAVDGRDTWFGEGEEEVILMVSLFIVNQNKSSSQSLSLPPFHLLIKLLTVSLFSFLYGTL